MAIREAELLWLINFLTKNLVEMILLMNQIISWQMNLISLLLKNLKEKKRKVYSSFKDNIWGVDLAEMQSLNRYNKRIKYLLCAIDLFSKYAWVIPMKDNPFLE